MNFFKRIYGLFCKSKEPEEEVIKECRKESEDTRDIFERYPQLLDYKRGDIIQLNTTYMQLLKQTLQSRSDSVSYIKPEYRNKSYRTLPVEIARSLLKEYNISDDLFVTFQGVLLQDIYDSGILIAHGYKSREQVLYGEKGRTSET